MEMALGPSFVNQFSIFQHYWEKQHDLRCVDIGIYGYDMVCTSMHEYLLAPSKVQRVSQPPAGARMRRV